MKRLFMPASKCSFDLCIMDQQENLTLVSILTFCTSIRKEMCSFSILMKNDVQIAHCTLLIHTLGESHFFLNEFMEVGH